jgi:hypothetical protein
VRWSAVFAVTCGIAGAAHADVDADLAATVAALPACDAGRAHCIGVRLHITVGDAGPIDPTGGLAGWLATQLATAGRHFGPLDVGFQVTGIDALPATAFHVATPGDRDDLAVDRLGGGVIHVFIVGQLDDIDQPGEVIRGVTWHTRRDDRKYIIVSTVAPERTLAHELGHFFGLPHSSYAVSIMNKRDRTSPPPELRTFAGEEIAAMRTGLQRLLRARVIEEVAK